jgi:hypothetical protein
MNPNNYYLIANILFILVSGLTLYFIFHPLFKVQKKLQLTWYCLRLLKEAKTEEDFEEVYHKINKSHDYDDYESLYFIWCLHFTVRLEEIQNSVLSKEGKDLQKMDDKPVEDLFNKTQELFQFFSSVHRYLNDEEQQILNSITSKKLGMEILRGSLEF